jgi:exodeoxyribonuclease VII large subunit
VGEHDRALTVSELLALARRALEPLAVTVVGEVTELTDRPGYKAVYFTLADDDAVLPCLVWRDAYERSACSLRCGMLVQATGAMTVYAPKGRMQFQVRTLAQAGEGLLRVQVAELARRLSAEGLMDPSRKRAVPAFPERVGVVTSPRGKAVHDVVRTLGRRFPAAEIVFAGVSVEGAEAVSSLMRGLAAVAGAGVDVMILARGGGSYEDLMPFNTEALARAIAECPVPVVTGIGHEPDTTIADMVADLRASTPTAAAEAVTPSCADVSSRIDALARTVGRAFLHEVRSLENRVRLAERSPVLADAHGWLALRAQATDLAADALGRSGRGVLATARARTVAAAAGLKSAAPALSAAPRSRFARAQASIAALSPLAVLERGYAVVYAADGSVVRDASLLNQRDLVRARLHKGTVECRVEEVTP